MGKDRQSGNCWWGGGWMVSEARMKGSTLTGGAFLSCESLFDSLMTDKKRKGNTVFEVKINN